jgi:hypothetical protein
MAYRPDYESADYQEGYADGKAESVKEWQGLTSEEIESLDLDNDVISVIFQTEMLLKEKNNAST